MSTAYQNCEDNNCEEVTTNYLYRIRGEYKINIFGVYPPIEYAIIHYKKVLLLGTCSTVKAVKNYSKGIDLLPLYDLANDVEIHKERLENIDLRNHLKGVSKDYDAVILGCTHYEFLRKKFQNYFYKSKILTGTDFLSTKIKRYLPSFDHHTKEQGTIRFVGSSAQINANFYKILKN